MLGKAEIVLLVIFMAASIYFLSAPSTGLGLADSVAIIFSIVGFARANVMRQRTSGALGFVWLIRLVFAILLLGDAIIIGSFYLNSETDAVVTIGLVLIGAIIDFVFPQYRTQASSYLPKGSASFRIMNDAISAEGSAPIRTTGSAVP